VNLDLLKRDATASGREKGLAPVSQALAINPDLAADPDCLPRAWKVLIVEPDPALAEMLRRGVSIKSRLQVAGIVARGEDALEFVRRHHCDLLLLDLRIAGMDGMQLLDRLRRTGNQVEVIVVSGSRSSTTVRAVLHRGAVDYLVKPFSSDRLRQALDLFVNRAKALGDEVLDQDMIDRACASGRPIGRPVPRGLTQEGVHRVRAALAVEPAPVSSSEMAARTGLARVTARRYLEHLVTTDQAAVEAWPTGPGRPRKLYRALIG